MAEHFENFFSLSCDLMAVVSSDGYFRKVNPAWERTLGFSTDELIDRPFIEFLHPDDIEHTLAVFRDHVEGRGISGVVNRYRCKDGLFRSLEWGPGSVSESEFLYVVARDVTERQRVQEALRESESRFQHVADHAPVLIWMSGLDKGCNYFNQVWLEFTGRSMAQEMGNGWAEGVHPDDLSRCWEIYSCAVDAHVRFEMEYRLKRNDGEYRWIFDTGVPRFAPDKTFLGFIGSCIDITDRKEMEYKLDQHVRMLEASENELKQFSQKILSIREDEKKKLAINLHDELGTLAVLLDTGLAMVGEHIRHEEQEAADRGIRKVRSDLKSEIAIFRKIAEDLRPPNLDIVGLVAALQDYFSGIREDQGLDVHFHVQDRLDIPAEAAIVLYRITREAVNNILRHAGAKNIFVDLTLDEKEISYLIRDDGRGFDVPQGLKETKSMRLGIMGMRERAGSLGGEFMIGSTVGKGTVLKVTIPIQKDQMTAREQ